MPRDLEFWYGLSPGLRALTASLLVLLALATHRRGRRNCTGVDMGCSATDFFAPRRAQHAGRWIYPGDERERATFHVTTGAGGGWLNVLHSLVCWSCRY